VLNHDTNYSLCNSRYGAADLVGNTNKWLSDIVFSSGQVGVTSDIDPGNRDLNGIPYRNPAAGAADVSNGWGGGGYQFFSNAFMNPVLGLPGTSATANYVSLATLESNYPGALAEPYTYPGTANPLAENSNNSGGYRYFIAGPVTTWDYGVNTTNLSRYTAYLTPELYPTSWWHPWHMGRLTAARCVLPAE
jgi:hypothetical protein